MSEELIESYKKEAEALLVLTGNGHSGEVVKTIISSRRKKAFCLGALMMLKAGATHQPAVIGSLIVELLES